MRATSANSLLASIFLHALVVAALVLTTLLVSRQVTEAPVIFELVAGPPTGGEELVAPALGNTTKPVKLEVPVTEIVPTVAADPEPVVQTQPEPPKPVEEATTPPPVEKPKPKPVEKPKPDTSLVKEMRQSQRMSYRDYLKKHPTPKPAPAAPASGRKVAGGPRVDATGIANGVRGGSTSNTRGGEGGKALSREQQDKMNTYISLLMQELKRAHEPPPGVSDRLEAKVTFDITAGGAILNPRITKSSGDKAFDDSVLDAFLRMRSIGPTPNRRSDTWTVTFRLKDEN